MVRRIFSPGRELEYEVVANEIETPFQALLSFRCSFLRRFLLLGCFFDTKKSTVLKICC